MERLLERGWGRPTGAYRCLLRTLNVASSICRYKETAALPRHSSVSTLVHVVCLSSPAAFLQMTGQLHARLFVGL